MRLEKLNIKKVIEFKDHIEKHKIEPDPILLFSFIESNFMNMILIKKIDNNNILIKIS